MTPKFNNGLSRAYVRPRASHSTRSIHRSRIAELAAGKCPVEIGFNAGFGPDQARPMAGNLLGVSLLGRIRALSTNPHRQSRQAGGMTARTERRQVLGAPIAEYRTAASEHEMPGQAQQRLPWVHAVLIRICTGRGGYEVPAMAKVCVRRPRR
jgi:hypothetical protein